MLAAQKFCYKVIFSTCRSKEQLLSCGVKGVAAGNFNIGTCEVTVQAILFRTHRIAASQVVTPICKVMKITVR